jgi:predicted O-methyltransferase YrrM
MESFNTIQYAAANLIDSEYKHVLEFGVYEGRTIGLVRDILDDSYKVYGFDSFEGLPEDWENTSCTKGFFSTNGVVPEIPGVKFFKGWFEDTIPDYLKECDDIALLHVDCDLYSSTKTIFKYLHPFIKKGTIIVFDEWVYNGDIECNDHEQKAFYEYVNEYNIEYEFVDYVDQENPTERKIVRIL